MTTAAYPSEAELIKELRLPERIGKAVLAQWKLHPTFPKPIAGMSGRRFLPSVEQWLLQYHGVVSAEAGPVVPASTGEKFNEWRQARKARRPRRARPHLPPTEGRVDVIGEWVPRSATGVTDVFWGPSKWLMGARWEEVDENFIWRHRLSKSVKGNQAVMNTDLGKTEEYDLRAFPPWW
jgi:hypothetical protein